jgi:hypothetical protein
MGLDNYARPVIPRGGLTEEDKQAFRGRRH